MSSFRSFCLNLSTTLSKLDLKSTSGRKMESLKYFTGLFFTRSVHTFIKYSFNFGFYSTNAGMSSSYEISSDFLA